MSDAAPGTKRVLDPSPGHDETRFPIHPWVLREIGLDHRSLAQSESLFALSNGHIGVRGNLDEGDPNGLPGTYLNSFYEVRPLPYAEAGFGYPEEGQTILNVTNGKLIRLLVDDEPFDLRYGDLLHHERTLDLRRGVLERTGRVALAGRQEDPAAHHPAGVAVAPLDHGHPLPRRGDRRAGPHRGAVRARGQRAGQRAERRPARRGHAIANPLVADVAQLERAAGSSHAQDARERSATGRRDGSSFRVRERLRHRDGGSARLGPAHHVDLARGRRAAFEFTKFVAYGWSAQRSTSALRDQVDAALVSAGQAGWDRIVAEQERHLEDFWDGADVEIDGSDEIQRAIRFGIFHAYQASVRAEQRCIAAKGLTGPGYDGHAFWDTEMFVLPLLTATAAARRGRRAALAIDDRS